MFVSTVWVILSATNFSPFSELDNQSRKSYYKIWLRFLKRFQTTEVNTDGVFDYNPTLFFSGIALMVFSPIIFCLPCMCRSCFQKCKCSACCKSGSALQSADQPAGDRKKNRFHHHYSIDSETGDVQPSNNETGKNEYSCAVFLNMFVQ